jgi:hypothetical protein
MPARPEWFGRFLRLGRAPRQVIFTTICVGCRQVDGVTLSVLDIVVQAWDARDMTQTATDYPARWTFPELAHADALLERHAATMPGVGWDNVPDAFIAWATTRDVLVAQLDAELAAVRTLICRKCGGRGIITGYRHRLGGVCFTCHGDGWTARGRNSR